MARRSRIAVSREIFIWILFLFRAGWVLVDRSVGTSVVSMRQLAREDSWLVWYLEMRRESRRAHRMIERDSRGNCSGGILRNFGEPGTLSTRRRVPEKPSGARGNRTNFEWDTPEPPRRPLPRQPLWRREARYLHRRGSEAARVCVDSYSASWALGEVEVKDKGRVE